MADDKKKKKSLPRAYDEDTKERTKGKAAEATERAAQRRKEWEAKTRESTERARARTRQMTGYNSHGKTFGTKAGTKEPAFGVDVRNAPSSTMGGLDALSSAASFEEYARKRREQDKEQGMKSAAARLAERNDAVNRAALPEAQEIDYAKAAENLRGVDGYGWKRVGNQVVFVTPGSPLPKPTEQNTATPAQAPGLYGIAPADYVNAMNAVSRRMQGDNSAEAQKAYDDALKMLGDNAPDYVSWRKADYYERYGDVVNAEELAGDQPIQYSGYGGQDGITLKEAKKYTNSPYAAQGRDRYGLQRWSQTTQQERDAYQLMLSLYGQEAADEYIKGLRGELNQRLAGATAQEAASYAQEHPVLGSLKTVANAPVQGAGMLEMGVEKLFGRDVDMYDPRLNLSRETEAARGTVAQNLGGVGGFLYNTGMSMVDNLANMAVYGGLGSIATTISMGAGSAASAFNSAVERGASENQAMGAAALSGIAEALFEKISLDNVITLAKGGGLKTVVGNIAKQSGIEASEELFTGIANEIGDRLIMGGLSNYELAMAEYMRNGMSEAEAKKQAMLDTAKEIGMGALGGALSGGLMGAGGQAVSAITGANTMQQTPTANRPARPSVPNMTHGAANAPAMSAQTGTTAMNANTQRMLAEAARQRAEAEQASMDEREQLMKEYQPEAPIVQQPAADVEPVKVRGDETRRQERAQREEERDYMPSPAQVKQQQAETAKPEQVEVQKNESEETASEGENGQMLKTQRTATVRDEDGVEKQVSVVGVMMDEGTPIMITRNEQGETDYTLADEMTFDADETELLGYEGIERMDAKGLRNYLDNYDASKGTAKEYADAYNTVYQRASAGLDYQQAAMENDMARAHMTEDARMSAYAAGLNAYNQTHETVQPAAVEATQATEAPAYAAMSAKEGSRGGRISRRYTQAAFGKLSKEGKQNAVAQMELLNAIASRTGRTITIVDSIVGKGGGHANALYNPETGEIRIALDATGGAYTYAAMHELTHAMKQEHAGEWKSFAGFVKETLENNKQNWDELVKYQMDQFGYTREQAEEEVICNTAPAMLQDESNVLKLYKGNRKLFERVVDWVKGMLKDIKAAGKALSKRSKSWEQMDALAKDRKALQEMYDRMMAVMESQPITPADLKSKTKFSMQEAVERKGDLIATHNISLANLREMVRIGGMPMPSIAVIKAKIGHVTYGPISMMFGKDSIDPKKDKRNRLYGNDAYTPSVYGAGARADVKSWEAFLKKLSDTVDAGTAKELKPYLQGKVGVVDELRNNTESIWENGVVYTRKEDMIAELSDSVEAKLAYLEEKGMPDDLFAPFAKSNDKAKQVSEFEKRLNEAAEQKAVEKWLEKELGKTFGEKIVTSYGGTAVPFTAENVLDNLHTQLYYGNVNTLDKTFATAVKTYRSIDAARKDKNRLGVDPEEAEKAYKDYETLVEDVKARVWEENGNRWNEGKIKGGLTPEEVVVDAGSIRSNPLKVRAHFAKFGLRVTNKTFQKIMELYKAAENIPTHYFESKPDRIVGFDEVRYAVVPESYRQAVEELFAQAGISTKVLTYKDGDDASRIAVMNSDDVEDVKFSMRDEDGKSHYDYSKPFAEQIDDWLDGNFPKGDTFLVSSTPNVLQKIGFSKLPMSYDQKHMRQVLGNPKNRDHDLGVDFMKALPELIADPVAIVTAPKNDGAIMMVLAHQNKNANDRPVVGIVRVEKGGGYNKVYVDANKLETVHSRGNLDEIITAAVEKEKAGGVGVYYVTEKKSLRSVLEHGQSQVLDSLNRTGYMHSIHDAGSNVKAELMDQTESRQFKRWFGDSKVVNEDGSPKLMYRGGNEDIEIFDRRKSKASNLYGRGFYFTESEEHAKQYGGVNSYYLRIEHPLDASSGDKQINQSQMRNFLEAVAEDEDYGLENYGYGATVDSVLRSLRGKDDFAALQDINATAVGDFVAAIELFNKVNGTKYDGIITPTETVVFDSRQIKSATDNAGTFDPENPNVKFSMQEPVEETRDLLAVHNLTAEKLQNALELGGLAMPSIAVIKAEQGHSMYGNISVIFDKSTIDPKASRDNEIYGADAWTPTFPQIEYEVDEAVERRIFEKYRKLRGKVGDQISHVMYRYAGDLAGEVGKHDGVEKIIEKMKTNTDMMQMYLADKGEEPLEPVKKTIIKRTGKSQAEQYERLIQKIGVDVMRSFETPEGKKIGEHRRAWMNEHREALQRAYVEILADATGLPEEDVAALAENKQNLNRMVLDAYNYLKTGGETREEVIDHEATEKAIRDAVDEKGYEKWLNDLFDGAVKRKGIRNNTDTFTPSGKRRSFAQTHWDVTLDNVVRAMRSEEKTGVAWGGRNIEGAAVKKYRSIKEVKADSDRLRTIDQDEYNAKRQEFLKRFSEIAYEYAAGKDQFDAGDALVEFITQNATADGIYRLMEKEAAFYKPSRKVAEELAELVEEMKNVPTGYFEAKPRRAIGFDEVAALVVPNDLNEEMRTELEKRGVNMVEYEAGNEADRLAKMNSNDVSQLRFSMRETDENVQDAMSAEEKAYAQVKGHRITAAEADKVAGEMLKLANSDYDRQKAASRLSRTIDYIERGEDVDWNQVDDELTRLAADVMSKSRTLDQGHEEMAKPIRDFLRTTPIRLTEGQKLEAENMAGTYGAYRKSLFGRVKLTGTSGNRLDDIWRELSDMNPELFPMDAKEDDMPVLLAEAVDALKPVYHSGMGMNMEESANWLAGKVHEAYLSLPTVKAAAKNGKTFGESIVALKNAMKRFEETSWTEYQNALREIRAARGAQKRTQQQEETEALRKKYVQWREKDTAQRKERELKRKYRARIERTAAALTNWMMKPTDAKHVPAGVEDSVRRMLETLDFSGKTTKTAADLCERLDGLADAIANAQEKEDGNQTMFLERDQQMIDEIKLVAERIRGNTSHQQREGRGVYDLNGMELRELSKWLDVVRHNVTEASKLRGSNLPGESVEQVASMSIAEMSRKKPQKDKKWATKQWNQLFGPDMQDSFTFFERMGPTANAIFRELRSGFDKVTQLTRQAEVHTKRILEGANLKEMTGKAAKKREFVLHSGRVEMTRAQIMELYVLSKREQAQGHIYGEGIKIQGDEDARPHAITKAEVKTITDSLSEDEKRIADGLQRFLSKECAGWGNETSMKLLGYRKFGEENYWPIRTDSNSRNTTRLEDNYAANISAIKNQGMTKATIEGAKNAIVIGDIFDSYTRHISNMAAYSGYALPLSDFTRWYNTRGVKTEVEQMMGQKGLRYINNFLMAVNGSALREEQGGLEKLAGTFSRNAKVASVGANARVVIQQPTSYARAAMYMSPKYLSKALAMRKPKEDLVNRYCGIAQWKRWGFYETNIGPNLRQMLVGDETAADKLREIAMMPAAMGDDWTLNHLWNACELETRDMYPEMVRGSEEYYQQVGKRMSEIIDRTQVVDSVFHRSQMMRSKNAMAQMLTNFMSEPTKTYNMLMSAISDYADNRRNKAARNRVARAFAVYGVTGLMTAAAAAVVDAFRDDDEEKEWAEKYLNAVGDNAKDNLNPLGLLPGVKDVLSLLEGYEPSRLDTQSIQRIIWAAEEIKKYAEGESRQNLYGVTYKTAQALSSMLGIPVSNLMRDLNAVVQTVTGSSITLNAEARKNSTANRLYDALEAGDAKKAKELRESLSTKVGMTPKEIDTAIAQRLVENPKIAEAWNAKQKRDYAAMNRIKNAMTAQGYGSEAFDKAVSLYDNAQKPKEEKTKDPNEQLQAAMYTEADVVSAVRILAGVETGGSITEDDVRAMMSERMGDSKAEDPEASVISGIQSELKKDYLAAEAKGDTSAMKRVGMVMQNLLGTKQDTMDGWVKTQHANNLRNAVDQNNQKAAANAVKVMRADGKTDSEIKSSLSKYKQLYIDAVNARDTKTANQIKTMLKSLGLKGKNGDSLYTDKHFADWLK